MANVFGIVDHIYFPATESNGERDVRAVHAFLGVNENLLLTVDEGDNMAQEGDPLVVWVRWI